MTTTTQAQTKVADVSTPSKTYEIMEPRWDLIDTLLGGTEALRAAREKYLPKFEAETLERYEERLKRNVLANYVEQTLNELAGKPFVEPITPNDDVPAQLKALLDDVDLQGTDLTSFAYAWFRDGFAKGFSWALVDMPKREPRPDGTPRTLADDARDGIRPFWNLVRPENVIAVFVDVVNGVEQLTHVRIKEVETVRDGWSEKTVVRVRVLEPGYFWLWVQVDGKWQVEESGETGLDFIPLVPFYAVRHGVALSKPPLTDLAYLNIAHWQSSSDQRNILTVSRFPILAVSGAKEVDLEDVKIGPYRWLATSDAQGKWYYVEHTGAAIEAGWKDLESLEAQMANYGAEFLRKKPSGQTATARTLDSAEALSALEMMAQRFLSSLEQLLYYTALYLRLDTGGTITMTTEFAEPETQSSDLDVLFKTRAARDISREAYLTELKRRRTLSEEYDISKDAEKIETESPGGNDLGGMFNKNQG